MRLSKALKKLTEVWYHHRWQNLNIDKLNDHEKQDIGLNSDG